MIVLGLSHKSAPVTMREAVAVPSDAVAEYAKRFAARPEIDEAVVLSTCNRVEVWAVPHNGHAANLPRVIEKVLTEGRGVEPAELDAHTYVHQGEAAIRHLMRVCASLDSLVVGEAQILGQVKDAVATAQQAGAIGPVLDRTLQAAFRASKQVRTRTGIAKATVSIGSVAVDLAKRIFASLEDTRVLLVGAGKMGRVTARSLASAGVQWVYVTNRSYGRALRLADEYGWHARKYSELEDLLASVDVVLTSTGARQPIIDVALAKRVVRLRKYRPLFMVDIAVPRDIAPAVADLDTVYLYNIDDLEAISRDNLDKRRAEADDAERIVDEAVTATATWHRMLRVKPTLAAVRAHAEALAKAEVDKALGKKLSSLDDKQQAAVRATVRGVVNKLLHPAMIVLRESAQTGTGVEMAAAARALFGVEVGDDAGHDQGGEGQS
ncbi:MAG: glutamyl-tRNA reductase [Proteobacteria bacterium]|nr:MAG: glutamyl-tRNA reductase [Pseudomonadota bacterium]